MSKLVGEMAGLARTERIYARHPRDSLNSFDDIARLELMPYSAMLVIEHFLFKETICSIQA